MQKKATLAFTLLTLTACVLSYKVGSTSIVLAKARAPQEATAPPPLPAPPAE